MSRGLAKAESSAPESGLFAEVGCEWPRTGCRSIYVSSAAKDSRTCSLTETNGKPYYLEIYYL